MRYSRRPIVTCTMGNFKLALQRTRATTPREPHHDQITVKSKQWSKWCLAEVKKLAGQSGGKRLRKRSRNRLSGYTAAKDRAH